jgi:hypothetical protein
MAIIPKPKFPNVPALPGVPQLARSLQFPASPGPVIAIAAAAGNLWQSIFAQPLWGIYTSPPPVETDPETGIQTVVVEGNKKPVVVPDSFGEFSYRNEWAVSDYAVQEGAFASYDKVAQPYEIMLRMYKGGSKEARKNFLDSIEAIAGDLNEYDIHTPERTYRGVNVLRHEVMRRGARGAYFLSEVDLYFREIRTTTATYSTTAIATQNARNVSAKPVVNSGAVQPQPSTTNTGTP